MLSLKLNSDRIGIISGILCLIHCIATPFLFLMKAYGDTHNYAGVPVWWAAIDYLFLVISFIAIHFATKNSKKKWLKISFWYSWIFLLVAILMEGNIPEWIVYIPALSIISLHFYNHKYCKCRKCKTIK